MLTSFLELFFNTITFLGHPFFWVIASAVIFWKGNEKQSFYLMTLIVISGIIVTGLKNSFKIPRPMASNFSENSFLNTRLTLAFDQYSFPSGHATTISSAYAFLKKNLTKAQEIFFISTIIAVSYSRIFLQQHFAIDVAFGIILGLCIGKTFQIISEKIVLTQKKTIAQQEIGLIITGVILLAVLLAFEQLTAGMLVFGYYFGFFLFKRIGFDSTKTNGKKLAIKTTIGITGIVAILSSMFFLPQTNTNTAIIMSVTGFWTTFIFPTIYEKALKNKTRKK